MNRLRFYYNHSLIGYFFRRSKEKWFTPPPLPPPPPSAQTNHSGIILQVDCLPAGMQEVVRLGHYERHELHILRELISPEDKVLEIGGAIGFIGLYCRKIIGVKELVSVEPNPKTLAYLRHNYALNDLKPSVIEAALTIADGPIQFQVSEMFWTDSLAPQNPTATDASVQLITVAGLSFQSLIQRAGIQFNTLIIDIEGGEEHFPVEGIPDYVTKVLIELHPDAIGFRPAYQILERLIRSGFDIQNGALHAWALKRKP